MVLFAVLENEDEGEVVRGWSVLIAGMFRFMDRTSSIGTGPTSHRGATTRDD